MRFSIRDLLWATVVVAMGLGWWTDHNRLDTCCQDFVATKERCDLLTNQNSTLAAEVRNLRAFIRPDPNFNRPVE
jgi:hypothetical protein